MRERFAAQVTVLAADLSLPQTPLQLIEHLQRDGIEISILVNNAGFGSYGPSPGPSQTANCK